MIIIKPHNYRPIIKIIRPLYNIGMALLFMAGALATGAGFSHIGPIILIATIMLKFPRNEDKMLFRLDLMFLTHSFRTDRLRFMKAASLLAIKAGSINDSDDDIAKNIETLITSNCKNIVITDREKFRNGLRSVIVASASANESQTILVTFAIFMLYSEMCNPKDGVLNA